MCIIHKGFRGFLSLSHASILGGILIGLKPAVPYEIIHLTLAVILGLRNRQVLPIKTKKH